MNTQEHPEMKSLFATKENFWLTMGLATGIARQALTGREFPDMQSIAAERFTENIRPGANDPEAVIDARKDSLANLEAIKQWLDARPDFQVENAFAINEAFTAYWLFAKLIELEWQKSLGEEALTEIYDFLDGTLAERAEVESIEKAYQVDENLSEDAQLFLRTLWSAGHNFFIRMRHDLRLLEGGFMDFAPQR